MKNLLIKECKLALHPTNLLFLALSAMLLIPEYPYYVAFFYTTLGVFFVCLTGRENHDIEYSMQLPIRKRDIVKARFAFVVLLEVLQLIVAIPFAILRQRLNPAPNPVGMDANIALFAFSLLMFGIFNAIFLTRYYSHPDKIGSGFVIASVVTFLYMGVMEAVTHFVPLFQYWLDTPDPQELGVKLGALALCAALYTLLTWLSFRTSAKRFEALDL